MQVEVVFALAEKQVLRAVELPEGATVAEVIEASNIAQQFPGSDRVELYRPLENEPREARRLKAGV
jgi:putative ubiquitin-RnfH superfamily antitoxin RatB of RatAB toxin-antitoxin module